MRMVLGLFKAKSVDKEEEEEKINEDTKRTLLKGHKFLKVHVHNQSRCIAG
jgi:hypothetical protein